MEGKTPIKENWDENNEGWDNEKEECYEGNGNDDNDDDGDNNDNGDGDEDEDEG